MRSRVGLPVAASVALAVALAGSPARANGPEIPAPAVARHHARPNVVIVMLDDVGFGAMATPTLDSLASQGLRYDRFHAGRDIALVDYRAQILAALSMPRMRWRRPVLPSPKSLGLGWNP